MENNNTRTYEVKDVLGFVINDLGNITIPASILGSLNADQIMAIKRLVIDPVENARRNLSMCVDAIVRAEEDQKAKETSEANEEEASEGGEIVPLPTGE